jgi:hypothetical protein
MARRILPKGRRFFTAEIDIFGASFRTWASRVRNVVEYRRAQSRWWNDVSLTVWLCHEQRARGIVALGSVQEAELVKAFERWPTTLGPVASEDVRAEVYRVLHPTRIALIPDGRRYQSICFSVGRASRADERTSRDRGYAVHFVRANLSRFRPLSHQDRPGAWQAARQPTPQRTSAMAVGSRRQRPAKKQPSWPLRDNAVLDLF